jgi:hypothetical protein
MQSPLFIVLPVWRAILKFFEITVTKGKHLARFQIKEPGISMAGTDTDAAAAVHLDADCLCLT